jgi:hypothetical protein
VTRYDLIVLVPWGIFSILFILLCVWLQVSCRRSQRDSARPARQAQPPGVKPADRHDVVSPGQERRRAPASTRQHHYQ